MKITLLSLATCLSVFICNAQLVITNQPSAVALAQKLVGQGVTISNVTFTGNSLMAGEFKNLGGTNIGLDSGIVLTTGSAKSDNSTFVIGLDGDGINIAEFMDAATEWFMPGDLSLANALGVSVDSMFDACVLEFDFIPSGDTVKFNYAFSSDEYNPDYVCEFNDAFAFFISGPGIAGVQNIALVPGTNIPVSIINVNDVWDGFCPNNPSYYVDNLLNTNFTHDGHTVALTAFSRVQPCNSYHLKIVIADFGDFWLDSGVFIEDKSFTSNEPPFLQSVTSVNSCGGNQLSLTFSENILCSSIQNADFTVTGPGGPYTITGWTAPACSTSTSGTTSIIVTLNLPISANGNFQVCLTTASGSVTDLCGTVASPVCVSFTNGATIPLFGSIGPICSGSTAPVLPTISNNGITGTWSPAVVSNTTSGTYTFTPAAGQCALPTTISIVVTTGILPLFNSITAICSGSTAPVLPTVSTNGITGSWSPATVSNTSSGIYTFTPNIGQCALSTTLPVIVNTNSSSSTSTSICINELPYSWNGNSYSAAGTYVDTLTGSGGCDSVATLILTTNPATTSTTLISVCNNQLPYSWNGNSYSAAGTYVDTLTGSGGCDSIATLILSANPESTSTTAITVCNNQLPYSWNGNSYPTEGTYADTLTGSGGCDSIATLILTTASILTSSTSVNICNNQLPYSWNGNLYPVEGTYADTLTGTGGCDSVATLILSADSVLTSVTPVAICESQLPYSWNGNNYTAAGSYADTLIGTGGCDSIATLILTVNPVTGSTTAVTICNTQLPYTWNGNSYPAGGTYTVTLTGSSGCDSVATLILTANAVVTSSTPLNICSNQLPYTWNGNAYTAGGTYTVTLTSSGDCDSIATLILTVRPVATSSTPVRICINQFPYNWNGNSYSAPGTYFVTLTAGNGCDSIARLILTQSAIGTSLTEISICGNQLPYTWNGNNFSVPGTYADTLINSAGCDSIATLILSLANIPTGTTRLKVCKSRLPYRWNNHLYISSGIYIDTLLTNAGCDSVATLDLTVQPELIADAGEDDIAMYNSPYQLSGSGGGQYEWFPSNVLNNPFIANPQAVLTQDALLILMVKDEIGCIDLDTVKLRVLRGPTFYVPTGFSPNNDGLNDIFRPTSVGIQRINFFRIFNRFGELIFETTDITNGWDGTYMGKPQDIGTYVWMISGIDKNAMPKFMKGNVTLIR